MNYLTLRQTQLELARKRQQLEFLRTQIPLEAGSDPANTLKNLIIDCAKLSTAYQREKDLFFVGLTPEEVSFIQKDIDIWVDNQLNPPVVVA